MITLEQYILNQQIDQILEDINNESINEGKVTKAIKRFWKWLCGDSSNSKKNNKEYSNTYDSHFEEIPTNLNNSEIKDKLSKQTMDYINFTEIHDKKYNTNAILFIKDLIKKYPNQFIYIESLLNDPNSILNIVKHNNDYIKLGLLKCENPFTDDDNKKILFTGICLFIPNLIHVTSKVLERIHKYSGTDKYDNYGFIICLDIMKNCKTNIDDYYLENKLHREIIKQLLKYTYSSSYSGVSTIINISSEYGKKVLNFYKNNLNYSEENNDNNKKYSDTKFLYNSNI